MKTHTQKFLQQRKLYTALPILVLPFITMIFWALGGGHGTPVHASVPTTGLNMQLPGAHFGKQEDELWDKFKLYEQAKRDSLKYEEARRNDPYYVTTTLKINRTDTIPDPDSKLMTTLGAKNKYAPLEQSEQLIHKKLALLTQQLADPQPTSTIRSTSKETSAGQATLSAPAMHASPEIEQLEKMMEYMHSPETRDPEMQQIEGMLDKILDIQHPERMRDKIREQSLEHKQQVFPVAPAEKTDNISIVEASQQGSLAAIADEPVSFSVASSVNGFYGLEEDSAPEDESMGAIEAVIHDTQTVVNGSIVKLRLLSDVIINGRLIQANQFIYGVCAINGERLSITVNSVRDAQALLPVALAAYDLDGLEGIYIPGAISRDVAKQSGSQSIQDVQLYSMDNSLGMQAATAGLEAAKGLFSRKTKLIKVTVKAGYQVLLKDTNTQNQ